jgi:hypothetical protein
MMAYVKSQPNNKTQLVTSCNITLTYLLSCYQLALFDKREDKPYNDVYMHDGKQRGGCFYNKNGQRIYSLCAFSDRFLFATFRHWGARATTTLSHLPVSFIRY